MNMIDWSILFGTWLQSDSSELLRNIFLGYPPFSEKPLKAIAHAGSLFFDAISILMAHMYQVGDDAHKKNEAVLNTTFVQMYDAVLYNSDLSTATDPTAYHDYGLARSANNKLHGSFDAETFGHPAVSSSILYRVCRCKLHILWKSCLRTLPPSLTIHQ